VTRALAAVAFALALSACAAGTPERTETLDVYAAASLTEAFTAIAADFEAEHPEVDVRLTFAGSSELAAQIREGAPADVFASANEAQMQAIADLVRSPREFASNTLAIAVPRGNPGHITGVDDLARPAIALVICAPQVPCGSATQTVAAASGLSLAPRSEESSVTDVLGKVAAGEADAGIVYVTDLARATGVDRVPLAHADAAVNRYPIAVVDDSDVTELGEAFIAAVLGPDGAAELARLGFGPP
jgi:molybdate transport system substrate-binding protein